ncbi:MAG: hypothetical protein AAF997_18020 [Myxococcota bacterium]
MAEQAVILLALSFASFIICLGAWGCFAPRSIVGFIESWSSTGGLWLAVLLRVSFGIVLWFAAPLSRTPTALQVLAVLSALSGVALPLFGYTRFQAFIEWWRKLPAPAVRVWCLFAVALGVFVFESTARRIVITVPAQQIEYRNATSE